MVLPECTIIFPCLVFVPKSNYLDMNYEMSNFEFIVANLNGIMPNGINNWNFCIDALFFFRILSIFNTYKGREDKFF